MRNKNRTLNEWMLLITEGRQSGLSDAAWCEQNDIPATSFYNAVSRMRKKACNILEAAGKSNIIDLTASKQEVVKIEITPDTDPVEMIPQPQTSPVYLDNSHTIEIATNGLCAIIQEQFSMEVEQHALYLFCGRKCDRIKAILKEPDRLVLIYKRLIIGFVTVIVYVMGIAAICGFWNGQKRG